MTADLFLIALGCAVLLLGGEATLRGAIGLALGRAVSSKLLQHIPRPMRAFAVAGLAAGVAVYAGVVLLPELPYMFLELFRSTTGSPGLRPRLAARWRRSDRKRAALFTSP